MQKDLRILFLSKLSNNVLCFEIMKTLLEDFVNSYLR